jgi:hypothetical protein
VTWSGDHKPRHVQVYLRDRLVAKWNLEEWVALWGALTPGLVSILRDLRKEGRL